MNTIQPATFFGSKEDFNKYIGPKLRNLVQQLSKKYKTQIKTCEFCNRSGILESAHKYGKERSTIINDILKDCLYENGYQINLFEFERKFK